MKTVNLMLRVQLSYLSLWGKGILVNSAITLVATRDVQSYFDTRAPPTMDPVACVRSIIIPRDFQKTELLLTDIIVFSRV